MSYENDHHNDYDPVNYDDSKSYNPNQLYCKLKKLQKRIKKKYNKIYLYQSDFDNGTYIIDKPGHYVLAENISFNPVPDQDHMPDHSNPKYNNGGFVLGFFAALVIKTKNVYLDLNDYVIEQSKEHALQQRFFAVIELADTPFIPKQGPGNFGAKINPASNIIIRNGTIGRSSHHGIHGNFNKWVLFENLKITDFEVAAIAINGSDSVVMKNIKAYDSRTDVPVLATYSASRFARMFGKQLSHNDNLSETDKTRLSLSVELLEEQMNETYNEIINTGKTTNKLYMNESGLPDGNNYGILFHSPGVAIDDFITEKKDLDWTRNVYLSCVNIENIRVKVNEIVGLSQIDGKGVQVDVAGAVFQIDEVTDSEGKYIGNVLSNLQLLLAELAIKLGIQLGKSNITQDVIDWANNGTNIADLLNLGYKYKCNGESMFHVNKGPVGYRFGGVDNMYIDNCSLKGMYNYGRLGNEVLDGNYVTSHDQQKRPGYCGDDTTGINLSYCRNIHICDIKVEDILSANGNSTAINIINSSKYININRIGIDGVTAGTLKDGEWVGTDYYGNDSSYTVGYPNTIPNAIGIYVSDDSNKIKLKRRTIKGLEAPGCEVPIWPH